LFHVAVLLTVCVVLSPASNARVEAAAQEVRGKEAFAGIVSTIPFDATGAVAGTLVGSHLVG
jgi:hypothetical protein